MRRYIFCSCIAAIASLATSAAAQEAIRVIPAPAVDNPLQAGEQQTAVLAGGCYWGTQFVFEHVKGVGQVVAGVADVQSDRSGDSFIGEADNPAESVKISFDPGQITYGQLLQIFFSVAHDATQLNRQGPDTGPQYRSEIFAADDSQKHIAESYVDQLQKTGIFGAPIVTVVDSWKGFSRVTESQQNYVEKHPTSPYVVAVDLPKLAALKRLFPALYAGPTQSSSNP